MKIIGSDYDGTIRINGTVSEESLKAIHDFREKGNIFGLVTGRSIESTKKELMKTGMEFDFIVCNNGGVVFDRDLKLLHLELIDFNVAKDIIAFVEEFGCDMMSVNDGVAHRAQQVYTDNAFDFHQSGKGSYTMEEMLSGGKIAQIVGNFTGNEPAEELKKAINERFGSYVSAYTNVSCCDIAPKGVSKANGLKYIKELYGFKNKDTFGIGDSYNDESMIQMFHGACLRHSPKDIIERSRYVVADIKSFIDIVDNL